MATAALNISGHTGTQLTRTLERVLEDAQLTGELRLSGRKLKEFPKIASKYNLTDTVVADLSKNRFSELPVEICDYVSMERLDCYHNAIRSIPESVIYLNSLTHLNLCRNQLTTIPLTLCQLSCLQVLIISNNKLVSIPEEVGRLNSLMELDVSCNEISHLPSQIEDLENLKSLDLRRNLLVELPIEITNLRLTKLDISCNRISVLPPQLRLIRSLVDLILDSNPLISPPAFLCTRGRVHIFKYLEIQAIKEDKKRGVISESDFRRSGRKASHGLNGLPLDNRRKRYTVDSGYNTSEGGDKRWSQELELNGEQDESRKLALRAAELTKEQRQERERGLQMRLGHGIPYNHPTILNGPPGSPSTPSTISPSSDTKEDVFTRVRELNRQKTEYEAKKRLAERVRLEQEEEEAREEQRRAARKIMEQQMEESRKKAESRSSTSSIFSGLSGSSLDHSQPSSPHLFSDKPQSPILDNRKSIPHDQTYREYREALKQRRIVENNNIYRRHVADGAASVPSLDNVPGQDMTSYPRPNPPGALVTNHITPDLIYKTLTSYDDEEEFRARHETLMQQQRIEAQLAQHRLEEERRKQKQIQKEAVFSYFKSRTSPHKMLETEQTHESYINKSLHPCAVNGTTIIVNLKGCSPPSSPKIIEAVNPNFTIRRDFDKAKEEAELIQQLRNAIEMRLKVTLPNDVSAALMDGVVLCHLANHVRPRSVSSIHVPSPAVPKLTMAKCRRNVENFLDACRRIGVAEEFICTPHEILDEMKSPVQVAITVQALLKFHHASKQNST